MSAPEERAKAEAQTLARHYFRKAWEKAGLRWERDNDAEVDDMIDAIVRAARA